MKKKSYKNLTLKDLDSLIAISEKGLSEANIGDIRQVRKIIFNLIKSDENVRKLFYKIMAKD